MRKLIFLPLICLLFYGTARFCHHQTKGFRLSKIQNNLCSADCRAKPSLEEEALAQKILGQKLRYFGRGKQSFAFVSEDDQYIVKIFNNGYQTKIQFFSFLDFIPYFKDRRLYFEGKLHKTFQSYALAFEELKDHAALCYLHIKPTEHLPKITLIDPLNIAHEMDPNGLGFVIQKKVEMAYPALNALLAKGERSQVESSLSSLISLFFYKYRQGIADNDPLIRTNYGFIGTQAIQIDIGPLSKDPSVQTRAQQEREIQRVFASLYAWAKEKCPDMIPFLDRELQQQLSYADDQEI